MKKNLINYGRRVALTKKGVGKMQIARKIGSSIQQSYENNFPTSRKLYSEASNLFPNGVTHDNRFLNPFPIYVEHALGCKKWDEDGNEYIDYFGGHGALLLGHGHPKVMEAVIRQIGKGTHYGACHRLEVEWAQLIIDMVPSAEKVRFVSSGTEATLMAVRLARIFTGKSKVLKFAGHFHGWHDTLIIGTNPPYDLSPPGIPESVVQNTIVCPPNDIEKVEKILREENELACIIIEPTGASFGMIPTRVGFLKELRKITDKYGVLLIFDEIITGFRCAPGGAQEYYGVTPDITTLGKILAGGFPGAAVVGRKDILELLEKKKDKKWNLQKKMFHYGTFNANPVSASAGIATLKIVATGEPIDKANKASSLLIKGMNEVIEKYRLSWCVHGEFSGFRFLLNHACHKRSSCDFRNCDYDYRKLKGANDPLLTQSLRRGMLLNGVDVTEQGGWVSAAHTPEDIEKTILAFDKTINWMKKDGLI